MDKDAYIEQLEKENAKLKKRIEELERLLGVEKIEFQQAGRSQRR
jgi:hypothetical protein